MGAGLPWYGCCDGDHAQRAEARDVGGVDGLDVLDAVATAAGRRRIGLRGVLEGVERRADATVANRVDEDLPAALVEHRDDPVELGLREVELALRRAVCVRLEHRRGVRFDDAVEHQLHGAGLEHRIVGKRRPEPLRTSSSSASVSPDGGGDRVVDAQVQLALLAELVVEREVVDAAAGILHAGHALRVRERLVARRSAASCSSRVTGGSTLLTRRIAASLSTPVGWPVRASFTIVPFFGFGVLRVMPAAASALLLAHPVCPS